MEDVQNEVRAVLKLCAPGTHENIVVVLRHGTLFNSPYYFFDMQLCDFNLESYSQRLWKHIHDESTGMTSRGNISYYNTRLLDVWIIMRQIANGVAFIHGLDEIHRDLKPRNGLHLLLLELTLCHFSSLLHSRSKMENCRFRYFSRGNKQNRSHHSIFQRHIQLQTPGIGQGGETYVHQQS